MGRPYYEDEVTGRIDSSSDNYQDYTYMWNGWWIVVVSMTTVGFGDYYPVTYFGRVTIVFACFVGTFIVSLSIVTMTNSKDFTVSENMSYTLIRRISTRRTIRQYAGRLILYFMRYSHIRFKCEKDPVNPVLRTSKADLEETLERLAEAFRVERGVLKPDEVPAIEKMQRIIRRIEINMKQFEAEMEKHQSIFQSNF